MPYCPFSPSPLHSAVMCHPVLGTPMCWPNTLDTPTCPSGSTANVKCRCVNKLSSTACQASPNDHLATNGIPTGNFAWPNTTVLTKTNIFHFVKDLTTFGGGSRSDLAMAELTARVNQLRTIDPDISAAGVLLTDGVPQILDPTTGAIDTATAITNFTTQANTFTSQNGYLFTWFLGGTSALEQALSRIQWLEFLVAEGSLAPAVEADINSFVASYKSNFQNATPVTCPGVPDFDALVNAINAALPAAGLPSCNDLNNSLIPPHSVSSTAQTSFFGIADSASNNRFLTQTSLTIETGASIASSGLGAFTNGLEIMSATLKGEPKFRR